MLTLGKRTLSALVAICVLTVSWFLSGAAGVLIMGLCVALIAQIELNKLVNPTATRPSLILFVIHSFSITLCTIYRPELISFIFALCSISFIALSLFFNQHPSNKEILRISKNGLFGFLYTGYLCGLILAPLTWEHGLKWFFLLTATVFSNDIFAYFIGHAFGKHPLAKNISPNKSTEGAIGGALASVAAFLTLNQLLVLSIPLKTALILGVLMGVLSPIGDLFESALKRVVNVKNSGQFMPGHGGALDRIDGLLFAAPVLYIYKIFM